MQETEGGRERGREKGREKGTERGREDLDNRRLCRNCSEHCNAIDAPIDPVSNDPAQTRQWQPLRHMCSDHVTAHWKEADAGAVVRGFDLKRVEAKTPHSAADEPILAFLALQQGLHTRPFGFDALDRFGHSAQRVQLR